MRAADRQIYDVIPIYIKAKRANGSPVTRCRSRARRARPANPALDAPEHGKGLLGDREVIVARLDCVDPHSMACTAKTVLFRDLSCATFPMLSGVGASAMGMDKAP